MVVALFSIVCFFIKTIIHHSAQEPFWLPCSLRFCVWPSLFWDGQAYCCVRTLYAQALPPGKLHSCHFGGSQSKICTFVVAPCPSTWVNTQGLCFVLTISQYFLSVCIQAKSCNLDSVNSWLIQSYLPRLYLYDYLLGHLSQFYQRLPSTPTVSFWKIWYIPQ
jgi:hypothetical protein